MMVIEKPIQFTIVSAVPFISAGAFWATSVEKSGESAMTTIPQNIKKPMKKDSEDDLNKSGDSKQHRQDNKSDRKAIRFVPNF